MNQYEQNVLDWLQSHNMTHEISFKGASIAPWDGPKAKPRKVYSLTIKGEGRGEFVVPAFYSSLDHTENNPNGLPSVYEILSCLEWHNPGSFEDFCSGYGYDPDSRKAYAIWEACRKEYQSIVAFFTIEEREQLAELCQ